MVTLLQTSVKGLLVTTPRLLVPAKNSTCPITPSASAAKALSVTLVPSKKTAPSGGLVKATLGGELLTKIMTGAEAFVAPKLSVATAVNTKTPRGALLHTRLYGGLETSPSLR